LTAVDGLMETEDGPPTPDSEALQELLSELEDVRLSDKLSRAIFECQEEGEEADKRGSKE